MSFTRFYSVSNLIYDPAIAPTKAIQNVYAHDNSHWQQPSRPRYDTTYRSEFINRIRHPDPNSKVHRINKSTINQYSVLPPIGGNSTINNNFRSPGSANSTLKDLPKAVNEQERLNNQIKPKDIPPLNFNNGNQNIYEQPSPPPPPMMRNNEDTYLPEEPVLLTDYEEERLSDQIRTQLANLITVERLKLFYQELAAYDPHATRYVHYSDIQLVASQLGLNLQEDTLRFAMCKFVSPDRPRGFVNYEDLVRYIGKCLSSLSPNVYGLSKSYNSSVYHYPNSHGYHHYECLCRHRHNPYFNHPCPIHHYYP